jgi:hypothetical protein
VILSLHHSATEPAENLNVTVSSFFIKISPSFKNTKLQVCVEIRNLQPWDIAVQTEHIAVQTEHVAVQTEHVAVQTEHAEHYAYN